MNTRLHIALLIACFVFADARQGFTQGARDTSGSLSSTASVVMDTDHMGTASIQVTGTYSGTITFEVSTDKTNYVGIDCFTPDDLTTAVNSTTATGIWTCSVAGVRSIRARMSSYTSGTAVVTVAVVGIGVKKGGGGGTTLTDCASLASAQSDETGTCGGAVLSNSPIFVDDFDLGAAGVRASAADGVLTLLGLGNGNDEDLFFDFDNGTANQINIDSNTAVDTIELIHPILTLRINNQISNNASVLLGSRTGGGTLEMVRSTGSNGRVFCDDVDCIFGHNAVGLFTEINGLSGIKLSPLTGTDVSINNGAHLVSTGTAPTLTSGFGTGETISGTDLGGKITVGSGGDTVGVITFNRAWTAAPACWVQDETTSNLMRPTTTTTTLTITGTMVAADVLAYGCGK